MMLFLTGLWNRFSVSVIAICGFILAMLAALLKARSMGIKEANNQINEERLANVTKQKEITDGVTRYELDQLIDELRKR